MKCTFLLLETFHLSIFSVTNVGLVDLICYRRNDKGEIRRWKRTVNSLFVQMNGDRSFMQLLNEIDRKMERVREKTKWIIMFIIEQFLYAIY